MDPTKDPTTPSPTRRLSAVWFADIVGFTTLASSDEGAAFRLVTILQKTSRRIAEEEYGGRVVKFIGDGVLAEFSSADAAVRSAIALQETFGEEARAAAQQPSLRIGIHLGEVIAAADGDIYGDGVNTASRLQGEALPGKVLISEDVWRQLRARPEFRFDSLGEVELRGMTARVAVFDVLFGASAVLPDDELSGAGPSAVGAVPATLARSRRRRRMAVLWVLLGAGVAGSGAAGVYYYYYAPRPPVVTGPSPSPEALAPGGTAATTPTAGPADPELPSTSQAAPPTEVPPPPRLRMWMALRVRLPRPIPPPPLPRIRSCRRSRPPFRARGTRAGMRLRQHRIRLRQHRMRFRQHRIRLWSHRRCTWPTR